MSGLLAVGLGVLAFPRRRLLAHRLGSHGIRDCGLGGSGPLERGLRCHRIAGCWLRNYQLGGHRLYSRRLGGHRLRSRQLSGHRLHSRQLSGHRLRSHRLSGHRLQGRQLGNHRFVRRGLLGDGLRNDGLDDDRLRGHRLLTDGLRHLLRSEGFARGQLVVCERPRERVKRIGWPLRRGRSDPAAEPAAP
jgi:hypothetical protein